jgi:hypothetical protein
MCSFGLLRSTKNESTDETNGRQQEINFLTNEYDNNSDVVFAIASRYFH